MFSQIEKEIAYVDISILKAFDVKFSRLIEFILDPSNLGKPSFMASLFITDSL